MPEACFSSGPSLIQVECPRCLRCTSRIMLARIRSGSMGIEHRLFGCLMCNGGLFHRRGDGVQAKPARKIGRARLAKAAKDAVGPRGLAGDYKGPVFEDRLDRHSAIVASPVARPTKLHRRLGRSDRRYGPTPYPERIVQAAASGLGAPFSSCPCQKPRRQSSLEYAGLRGEGSTPVPLPPPAWPEPSILSTRLLAIRPVLAAISDLNSGPLIDGVGSFFSEWLISLRGSGLRESVRFSKFERFEMFMNSTKWRFPSSSRTGKSIRFRNRHFEVRNLPPQPPIRAFRQASRETRE
jgi:hypothetical protein